LPECGSAKGQQKATFREDVPPQPVDATPSNRQTQQFFPMKSDLYVRIQSEPKQGFCFDCLAVRERKQPRRRLPEDFEQVLYRPIETAQLLRHWREL
jgi:hypothetical protein